MKSKNDIAREYVEKYIELGLKNKVGYSKRWIASVILAEHPEKFKDIEDARLLVRRVTHSNGVRGSNKMPQDTELARAFALLQSPHRVRKYRAFCLSNS